MPGTPKPIVLITGAAGNIGRSLAAALSENYSIVGLDQPGKKAEFPLIGADFTDDASIARAVAQFRQAHGDHIASVIHLVAFFDFTGEENPLYQSVNVEGTRRLLRALRAWRSSSSSMRARCWSMRRAGRVNR